MGRHKIDDIITSLRIVTRYGYVFDCFINHYVWNGHEWIMANCIAIGDAIQLRGEYGEIYDHVSQIYEILSAFHPARTDEKQDIGEYCAVMYHPIFNEEMNKEIRRQGQAADGIRHVNDVSQGSVITFHRYDFDKDNNTDDTE